MHTSGSDKMVEEGAVAVMIEDDEEAAMMREILKRVQMELPPLPPKSLHNNNGSSLAKTVSNNYKTTRTYNNIIEPDEEVMAMMMMLPPPPPPPHIKLLDRRCMDSVITHLDSTSIESMSQTCKFFRDACAAADVTPVIGSRSKYTEANVSAGSDKAVVPVNDNAPLDELSVQEEEVDNRSLQDVQVDVIQSLVNLDILPSSSFDAPLDELSPHTAASPPRNNVVGMSKVDNNNPAVALPSNQEPAPSFDECDEKNCIQVSSDDSYDNTTIGTDDDQYEYQQQQQELDDTFSLQYSDDDEHYASEQNEVGVEGPSPVEPMSFYTLDSPTKRSGECEDNLEEPTTVKRLSVNSLKAIHNTTWEYAPCTPPKEPTTVKCLSVNSLKAISNTTRENTPCTPPKEAVPFTPLRSNGTNTPSTTQSSTCSDEHDSNQDCDSRPDDEVEDDVQFADVDDDSEEEDVEGDEAEEETSNSGALLVNSLADFIGGVSGLATDVVSIFAGDVRRNGNGIDDYGPIKIGEKVYSPNEALQMWKKAKANMDLEDTYGEVDYSGNDKFETTTFFEKSSMYSEKTAKMEKRLGRLEKMPNLLDEEPEEPIKASYPKKQGSSVIMAQTNGADKVKKVKTTSFFESTAKMDLKLAPRLGEKNRNDEPTRKSSTRRQGGGMGVKQEVNDEKLERLGKEYKNEKMAPLEKDSHVDGKLATIEHKSRNEEPQSLTPRSRGGVMSMTQARVLQFLQEDAAAASSLERRSRSSPEVSREEIDTDTATSGSTVSSTYQSSGSYTSSEVDLDPSFSSRLPRVKQQPMPQASLSNEDGKSVAIDSVMGSNYGVEVSSHCCKFVSKDDSQTIKDAGGYKESEVVASEPVVVPKSMPPQRFVSSRKPRVLVKHGMGITSTKRRNSKTVKEEKKKPNLSLKKLIKKK